jgi:hypothetical protein
VSGYPSRIAETIAIVDIRHCIGMLIEERYCSRRRDQPFPDNFSTTGTGSVASVGAAEVPAIKFRRRMLWRRTSDRDLHPRRVLDLGRPLQCSPVIDPVFEDRNLVGDAFELLVAERQQAIFSIRERLGEVS